MVDKNIMQITIHWNVLPLRVLFFFILTVLLLVVTWGENERSSRWSYLLKVSLSLFLFRFEIGSLNNLFCIEYVETILPIQCVSLTYRIDIWSFAVFSEKTMTEEAAPKKPTIRLIPSTRFTLALLVSFALFTQYAQRVGLSMAIVCMVDRTAKSQTTTDFQSFNLTTSTASSKLGSGFFKEKRFPWSEFQQQVLLGSYWFGYIFTLVPSNQVRIPPWWVYVLRSGGGLSIKWGPKKLFTLSLLFSSIATVAIPSIYFLEDFHFYVALLFRAIIGFTHGPLFPATYTFWSKWAVPLERSTLASIGFCSNNIGTCTSSSPYLFLLFILVHEF